MTTRVPALAADEGEPSTVFDLLTAAGWTTHTDPTCNTQVISPGGQARVVFQPESAEYATTDVLWKAQVVTFAVDPGETFMAVPAKARTWSATFTGEVPVELIGAFLKGLTDPDGFDRSPAVAPGEDVPAAA